MSVKQGKVTQLPAASYSMHLLHCALMHVQQTLRSTQALWRQQRQQQRRAALSQPTPATQRD
jgi:hypothetical protein